MNYTFEILGISPVIYLFNTQQVIQQSKNRDLEYLGVHKCTLDTFVESVEGISKRQNWPLDQVVNTVVDFWMNHPQTIQYWAARLEDAGGENLLLARVGKLDALRKAFESLFRND
uniref:Uncharacterized protein n=1 Tax=Cyanothece sp. (strain PCC 7425 / ATCC 29141) TaxID=395961 RepID=B8HW81_CYAP4